MRLSVFLSSMDLHLRRSTCTSDKIDLHVQRQGFRPKRNHFRGQSSRRALILDILDADRSPNAVRFHVGTQVDFEVDRPSPANSLTGDLFITMVKETVILYKKEFRKMKESCISH